MMEKKIQILITLSGKILSVNSLYAAKLIYKYGKPVPAIYKVGEAKKMEEEMRDQCRAVDFSQHLGWLRETQYFDLNIQFVFKTNINKRDTSNACKCAEDCWVRFVKEDLGVDNYDDAKHARVILSKSIIPGAEKEYICLQLTPSTLNVRYDKIEKPEQLYIHGMVENQKTLKKGLKELGLKCQFEEDGKKIKEYNTEIFLIDHDLSMSEGIDIINYIHSHLESEFIIFGFKKDISGASEVIQKIKEFGLSNIIAYSWSNQIEDLLNIMQSPLEK